MQTGAAASRCWALHHRRHFWIGIGNKRHSLNYSEMHNKVLQRCCALARRERFYKALKAPTNSVPYYLYCLRLRALYHFILHSTIVSILKNNFKVYGRCDVIGIDWVSHRRNPTQSKWLDKINRLKNRCWVTALAA